MDSPLLLTKKLLFFIILCFFLFFARKISEMRMRWGVVWEIFGRTSTEVRKQDMAFLAIHFAIRLMTCDKTVICVK